MKKDTGVNATSMERHVDQLSDDDLRGQLLDSYRRQTQGYPDSAAVQTLKSELYRRGYTRTDIVTIALAALLSGSRSLN